MALGAVISFTLIKLQTTQVAALSTIAVPIVAVPSGIWFCTSRYRFCKA